VGGEESNFRFLHFSKQAGIKTLYHTKQNYMEFLWLLFLLTTRLRRVVSADIVLRRIERVKLSSVACTVDMQKMPTLMLLKI
jgi:hypothetical protein